MIYVPGTWVWIKQDGPQKLWWPGQIVSLTPEDIIRENIENGRNYIAVIYFGTEETL